MSSSSSRPTLSQKVKRIAHVYRKQRVAHKRKRVDLVAVAADRSKRRKGPPVVFRNPTEAAARLLEGLFARNASDLEIRDAVIAFMDRRDDSLTNGPFPFSLVCDKLMLWIIISVVESGKLYRDIAFRESMWSPWPPLSPRFLERASAMDYLVVKEHARDYSFSSMADFHTAMLADADWTRVLDLLSLLKTKYKHEQRRSYDLDAVSVLVASHRAKRGDSTSWFEAVARIWLMFGVDDCVPATATNCKELTRDCVFYLRFAHNLRLGCPSQYLIYGGYSGKPYSGKPYRREYSPDGDDDLKQLVRWFCEADGLCRSALLAILAEITETNATIVMSIVAGYLWTDAVPVTSEFRCVYGIDLFCWAQQDNRFASIVPPVYS